MAKKLTFKSVVISDVHLGTSECRIQEVNRFLKGIHCERLVLNGDIIDGWQLLRSGRWTSHHTDFVRLILEKIEKHETEVVYLRGNHDCVLSRFLPLRFDRVSIQEDCVWETERGRYLILHGDIFDLVTSHFTVLAHLGDFGYQWLLRLNRAYNCWRAWRGKEYYSISKAIKARIKCAVNFASNFEQHLTQMAIARGCQGVICGHIHFAADKMIGPIHYLNSGDWVETMSAVVEHTNGRLELLTYQEFCDRLDGRDDASPELESADAWENDSLESAEAVWAS